jgi:hypothetical protein
MPFVWRRAYHEGAGAASNAVVNCVGIERRIRPVQPFHEEDEFWGWLHASTIRRKATIIGQ